MKLTLKTQQNHCGRSITAGRIYERGVTEQSEVKNTHLCLLLWKQRPVMRRWYPRVCVIWAVLLTVQPLYKQTGEQIMNETFCWDNVNKPQKGKK